MKNSPKTGDMNLHRQESLLTILRTKLKDCDLDVQNFVSELEAENLKLHRQIVKYQVQEVSLNNRIKALKENRDEDYFLSIGSLAERMREAELVINKPTSPGHDPNLEKRRRLQEDAEDVEEFE